MRPLVQSSGAPAHLPPLLGAVIPIEAEDFQAVYYFLSLEKGREEFREFITQLLEKEFRPEPL